MNKVCGNINLSDALSGNLSTYNVNGVLSNDDVFLGNLEDLRNRTCVLLGGTHKHLLIIASYADKHTGLAV